MTQRLALVAFGFLYAAAAVWLVHTQGASYRRLLRERRASQVAAAPTVVPPAAVPDSATETRPKPPEPGQADRPVSAPRAKHKHPGKRPDNAVASVDHSRGPAPTPPRGGPVSSQPYASPVALRPLVIAGLENAPAAEEARFGEALHKLILINHPALEEGSPEQRTILEAVEPLLDQRDRKDLEVTITVLDSDEVNAFSHMGGYLYVTRGLFNLAATEDEFQFVVAHELAHIDLKHGQGLLAQATKDGTVAQVGTLQAMYHQVAAGYTEAQEFAADDRALDRMLRLDHTTRECLMFLRKFRRLSEEQKFREGRKAPRTDPAATVQDVDNHTRAQPAAWKRLERLEKRLNATPARRGGGDPTASGR